MAREDKGTSLLNSFPGSGCYNPVFPFVFCFVERIIRALKQGRRRLIGSRLRYAYTDRPLQIEIRFRLKAQCLEGVRYPHGDHPAVHQYRQPAGLEAATRSGIFRSAGAGDGHNSAGYISDSTHQY